MAATTYTSTVPVTIANTAKVLGRLHSLALHLPSFGLHMTNLVLNPDKTISITLNGPLPAAQLAHLSLDPQD